jgi:AcrR family transcriptional regulator
LPALKPETLAERRDVVLAAALKCFARDGFRATSMRDICAEAGVSTGAVYCHFKSKEEIVHALAAHGRVGRNEALDAAIAAAHDGDAAHAAATAMRALTDFIDRPGGRKALAGEIAIMGEAVTAPAMRSVLASVDAGNLDAFAAIFAAAGDKPKAARAQADLAVAALYGILILAAFHDGFDRKGCIATLADLLAARRSA